ncbi:hypothetical protein [Paracidovorax anthurii]|uniref:Uncharacterized protein n=1 Tax=Paracidovorax anthurii TaxID=78229 RepID=A0A328ZCF4_9BURK|nr:hypothetical protein [Paracidovorax anthurii]RAR83529.1 hypothetical protein AX018_101435 [Paracidovorax anthurii]
MSFNTLEFKFCPRCGQRLSYTSYEGYCAYSDCRWNNDEATESTPPAESLPDPSVDAGLVAQSSVGGGECPSEDRVLTLDECQELERLWWATCDGHGSVSKGGFVLMALQQAADMRGYLSNSERVAAYDRLCRHAGYAIGAGC